MELGKTEAKLTIAKLIELAYSQNKGMTAKIMAKKGRISLSVDESGNATLTGSAGFLSFSGKPALEEIAVNIKRVSISFNDKGGSKLGYAATFDFGVGALSVYGDFNIEKLITSCSGLLCQSARLLKNRQHAVDEEFQRIMGN